MTKLEQAAMQQALEVLDLMPPNRDTPKSVWELRSEAITALREALANTRSSIRSTSEYSEQAEQEPVAKQLQQQVDYWINHYNRKSPADMELLQKDVAKFAEDAFAAPVQQVDLTDDELLAIAKKFEDIDTSTGEYSEMDDKQLFIAVIRAVIAADREKNK